MPITHVILADNQALTRLGLTQLLAEQGLSSVEYAENKIALEITLRSKSEVLVIIDYLLFDFVEVKELALLANRFPKTNWLFLIDVLDESWVYQVSESLPKANIALKTGSKEELLTALSSSKNDRKYYCSEALDIILGNKKSNASVSDKRILQLTATEKEIVQLLAQGKTTKNIANERHLSYHTIITHRKNIFRKLEINTLYELTKYALKNGLADLTEYYI